MVAFHILVVVVVIVAASFFIHSKQKEGIKAINTHIEQRETEIMRLSDLTSRNAGDNVINEIINDCPRRAQFESLLTELASLNQTKLLEIQQLFDSCGDYYAILKSIMVFRIEKEFESLSELFVLKSIVEEDNELKDRITLWNELIELEKKRRDLLTEQVAIQESIITSLIRGHRATSPQISTEIVRAQEVGELLSVHSLQIQKLHETLDI